VEANDPPALTERLTSLGYRWAAYDPAGRQVTVADGPPAKGANGIAVADFEALQDRLSSP
jgi:hypothetical protein